MLLPIFFRKKFKKIWQRRFENGYWFEGFLVGLLVLIPCRFTMGFFQVCFFQFFSEKNLKNFGRGVLKMVIGLRVSRRFIGSDFLSVYVWVSYRFASSNFFQKKI